MNSSVGMIHGSEFDQYYNTLLRAKIEAVKLGLADNVWSVSEGITRKLTRWMLEGKNPEDYTKGRKINLPKVEDVNPSLPSA